MPNKTMMPKEKNINNQKGQTFLEFILILVLLMSISFTFIRGFRYMIGSRWEVMLKIIAVPNQDEVKFP